MTKNERCKIYTEVFDFLIEHNIHVVPLDIEKICSLLNIKLISLSEIVETTGLTSVDIFNIWGNEDGSIMACHDKSGKKSYKIAYNDYRSLRNRFTQAEELAHVILKHTDNPEFCIFQQNYSQSTYAKYDEEARIAAGFLLCPPNFFYENEDALDEDALCDFCNVSHTCARARIGILNRFRDEVSSHPLYKKLPQITCAIYS